MQMSKLDPAIFRKLTVRLVGEQRFRTDPAGSVLIAFEWLNRVVTDTAEPAIPIRDAVVSRLEEIAQARGLSSEALARELKISLTRLQSWQRGIYTPSKGNLHKIEEFLNSQPPPIAGAEQPAERVGELFGQQQAEPEPPAAKVEGGEQR